MSMISSIFFPGSMMLVLRSFSHWATEANSPVNGIAIIHHHISHSHQLSVHHIFTPACLVYIGPHQCCALLGLHRDAQAAEAGFTARTCGRVKPQLPMNWDTAAFFPLQLTKDTISSGHWLVMNIIVECIVSKERGGMCVSFPWTWSQSEGSDCHTSQCWFLNFPQGYAHTFRHCAQIYEHGSLGSTHPPSADVPLHHMATVLKLINQKWSIESIMSS